MLALGSAQAGTGSPQCRAQEALQASHVATFPSPPYIPLGTLTELLDDGVQIGEASMQVAHNADPTHAHSDPCAHTASTRSFLQPCTAGSALWVACNALRSLRGSWELDNIRQWSKHLHRIINTTHCRALWSCTVQHCSYALLH